MKIRMLETRRGSEDGFAVRCYLMGRQYDMADGLARAFLAAGCAAPVRSRRKNKTNKEVL